MPTSIRTSKELLRVIYKYVPGHKVVELLKELQTIEGNESFKKSIKDLLTIHKQFGSYDEPNYDI